MTDCGACTDLDVFDITTALLGYLLDSCCKNIKREHIWKLRMVIGLVFSIIDLMVIAAVNKDDYLDNTMNKFLFTVILLFAMSVYISLLASLFYQTVDVIYLKACKFLDVVIDVLLLVFTHVVASNGTGVFEIICTVFVCVDILMDLASICFGKV